MFIAILTYKKPLEEVDNCVLTQYGVDITMEISNQNASARKVDSDIITQMPTLHLHWEINEQNIFT